jgi:hypothetical protein
VTSAVAVPHIAESDPNITVSLLSDLDYEAIYKHLPRIRLELVSSLGKPPLTNANKNSLDSVASTVLHAQTRQLLRCSKSERENLRQALISWRDQRCAFAILREWIITDKNIVRLVHKAHLLLNQPRLDIEFLKGMMRDISINTILSSLVTMLEAFFCSARRESLRYAQKALGRRLKCAYRRRQDSDSKNINSHVTQSSQLLVHKPSSGN